MFLRRVELISVRVMNNFKHDSVKRDWYTGTLYIRIYLLNYLIFIITFFISLKFMYIEVNFV